MGDYMVVGSDDHVSRSDWLIFSHSLLRTCRKLSLARAPGEPKPGSFDQNQPKLMWRILNISREDPGNGLGGIHNTLIVYFFTVYRAEYVNDPSPSNILLRISTVTDDEGFVEHLYNDDKEEDFEGHYPLVRSWDVYMWTEEDLYAWLVVRLAYFLQLLHNDGIRTSRKDDPQLHRTYSIDAYRRAHALASFFKSDISPDNCQNSVWPHVLGLAGGLAVQLDEHRIPGHFSGPVELVWERHGSNGVRGILRDRDTGQTIA